MKWGQRKASSSSGKKSYTSNYTKAYQEAASKQSKRAAKYNAKVKRGSLYRISGLADLNQGRTKSASRNFARAEKKEAKWKEKANKAETKSKEYSRIAKNSANLDKKVDERRQSQSASRRIASALLDANGTGNRPYSTMRAAGVSRGKAVISSILNPSAGLNTRDKYSKKK